MIENLDIIKKRFQALWQNEMIDRCMVSITVTDKNYVPEVPPENYFELEKYWTDAEWVHKRIMKKYEHTRLYGDSLPLETIYLGTAGQAGFFENCNPKYTNRSIWFEHSLIDYSNLEFDKNRFLYKKTIEFAEYLTSEGKDTYFAAMPDITGNTDALSNLRGPDKILLDFIECPDKVQNAMMSMQHAWESIMEEVYSIISKQSIGGSSVGWLKTWAPSKHGHMQCDLACMISPQMYRKFTIPELKKQCEWMDYPLYHFDGVEQIRHLDALLSLEKLKMVQWTHVTGQPSPINYIKELKQIQDADKSVLIPVKDANDIPYYLENLSSKKLYLLVNADSDDEAESILKLVKKLSHD